MALRHVHGRGATTNPPNRFEELQVYPSNGELAQYFEDPEPARGVVTKFYYDHTRSILAKNDSPDIGFTYSLNPYRGCEHGCIYCYARPTHEYLGFSSGIDFESKIMVKLDAPRLLEETFNHAQWEPQVVAFSGNTDCYQPAERTFGLTRKCLEVFLRYRNPVSIITKNALIQRDVDLLKELASRNLVVVILSITTLDASLVRIMEPRTATPRKRLETIEYLSRHGIPTGVNVAPIIPGLNESEMPRILRAAACAGATRAGYTLVRLPYAVKELFQGWLQQHMPGRASNILHRLRAMRGGSLSNPEFGRRMTGEGVMATTLRQLFDAACAHEGLNKQSVHLRTDLFTTPKPPQMNLFSHEEAR
jgi:DNA repair photolyase